MRIGLVLPAVPGYSETFFVNKIRGLHLHGHEVFLFVSGSHIVKTFEGATVVAAPKLSGNLPLVFLQESCSFLILLLLNFKVVRQFYRLERNEGTSFFSILKKMIINHHLLSAKLDWLHFGFGTMALERENVAQAIGAKMAVSFRGFDIAIYPLKNPNCYDKLWKKVDKVHVISDDIADLVYKNGFQNKEKIFKVCPAIDVNYFSNVKETEANQKIQILTIARLHWKKGLEYTLEALALLKKKGVAFQYTIVGDGIEKERLLFAAHQLGLTDSITFTGKLEPTVVRQLLGDATLYVQYSIQEGFCNAVLEAQAMGKLCIVSDAEGLSENVIDGVTGFVVAKRNPVSLAEKIQAVTEMTENEKSLMTEKAISRMKNEFTLEQQQNKFLAFYNF
ncbi:MAG TPA: glycosyltransferase family 4 protein [Flavobacterium sp.]|nr:glycosyltransferase family 4 protein [Flavobacterium sp.]